MRRLAVRGAAALAVIAIAAFTGALVGGKAHADPYTVLLSSSAVTRDGPLPDASSFEERSSPAEGVPAATALVCENGGKAIGETIGARYLIRVRNTDDAGRAAGHALARYAFFRQGRRVLHEYGSLGIAESFFLMANERVRATRHFDRHARSIEFEPIDRALLYPGTGRDWARQSALVDPTLRSDLERSGARGSGCTRVEHLVGESDGARIALHWLPAHGVAASYTVETPGRTERWVLSDLVTDAASIAAEFDRRDGYAATDFADIGDNESDPFLMRMIDLGFIEHGASGFYGPDGRPLGGGGHVH